MPTEWANMFVNVLSVFYTSYMSHTHTHTHTHCRQVKAICFCCCLISYDICCSDTFDVILQQTLLEALKPCASYRPTYRIDFVY